jgi:restriction system protein
MAIPDYQSIMLPLLKLSNDGEIHKFRASIEELAKHFHLSPEERKELLPSGKQPTFDNRVGWARTYMTKAGLLNSPKRGLFQITQKGKDVLAKNPSDINVQFLEQFPEFMEFRQLRREKNQNSPTIQESSNSITPEENLENSYQALRSELGAEILSTIKSCSPDFFEQLVIDLLVTMGYGGSRKEAGEAIGKSGDEGIDGIIKEDQLGLDIIYIQAKRWESVIGRPEIQKFAGALQGQRAKKGIFITTSGFSKDAIDYACSIDTKIILIDGVQLVDLMIDHNVGVSTEAIYELKRIDSDYFTE